MLIIFYKNEKNIPLYICAKLNDYITSGLGKQHLEKPGENEV